MKSLEMNAIFFKYPMISTVAIEEFRNCSSRWRKYVVFYFEVLVILTTSLGLEVLRG